MQHLYALDIIDVYDSDDCEQTNDDEADTH